MPSLTRLNRLKICFLVPLFIALAAVVIVPTTASAGTKTPGCGGKGERTCPLGWKATYISKAQTKCPKGSFFDISTAACWSCPRGSFRSVFPIKGNKACQQKPRTDYSKADKKKKLKLKVSKKNKCKKGQFWDKKGGKFGACWSCPKGYKRGVSKVDGHKACLKVTGLKSYKSTRMGNFQPCRKGFFDPRAKGQCWSCPKGYFRGVTKVNSKDACFIKPAAICDRGLVPDLISNRCVNTQMALCLAVVRVGKGAKGAGNALKKLINSTPGLKKTFNNRKKNQKRAEAETKRKKKGILKKLFVQAEAGSKQILAVKAVADKAARNVSKIRKAILREKFCTMTPAEGKKLVAQLNLKPTGIYKKASLFDGLSNPFIKSAHAANPKNFYMSYAVSVAGGAGLGGAFELSLVTDYDKHVGSFVAIGPALVSNATIGASVNIGFYWNSHIDDFKGWGWGIGVGGGPPTPPIGVGVDFYIPFGWHKLDGIGFNVGAGVGILPVDGNISASYAWRMW
jgi:hypothetical protein